MVISVWCFVGVLTQGANTQYISRESMPGGIAEADRRTFRNTNYLGDIEGSGTGSLK